MQGIEQLTNIMTEGGRSDVPMSMGAQPMGAPQGIAGMMSPQDMAMMQQGQVPNPADSAPQGIDINSDADMLASAVVGRTNGDLDEAEQVLEQSLMLIKTAKAQSTQQPMMAAYGKPIMAAEGRAISSKDLGEFQKESPSFNWKDLFYKETPDLRNVLRNLIANSLTKRTAPAAPSLTESGRTLSERDKAIVALTQAGVLTPDEDEITVTVDKSKPMRPSNKPGVKRYADGGEVEEYAGGGVIYLP